MAESVSTRPPVNYQDLTGERHGRLTVLRYAGLKAVGRKKVVWVSLWECRCECGRTTVTEGRNLRSGMTRSCGCLLREPLTHGRTYTPEYMIWGSMIQRCTNPNSGGWKKYGGRGITVCRRWAESFEAFLADMGPKPSTKHSLERTDNDKGYEPGNVRWATTWEQNRNRRDNVWVTYRGETLCLWDWSERLGINYRTLRARLGRLDWTLEEAFTAPVRPSYPRKKLANR